MASLQENFRKQYGPNGIYAGASHFHDYWSRDALFACFGALTLKDYEQVERTINSFLYAIDETGHVPVRIGAKNQVLQYLHLPTKQGVWHNQDKGRNPSFDGNALLLIVAERYEAKTKKRLERTRLRKVAQWLDDNNRVCLLHQGEYSCWEDSIKITGPRLYTNVCYYRALVAAEKLFGDKKYGERAKKTRQAIQLWWNQTYFTDGPKNKACLVAGNLLAALWGVATKKQSEQILGHIAKRNTIVPPAGFWKPTMREAYMPFFFIHLQDYHGMMEWSWLAAIEIAAYRAVGNTREANRRYRQINTLIDAYDGLYEVYTHDAPVRRLIYRSERNFAWALGLLIASQPSGATSLR